MIPRSVVSAVQLQRVTYAYAIGTKVAIVLQTNHIHRVKSSSAVITLPKVITNWKRKRLKTFSMKMAEDGLRPVILANSMKMECLKSSVSWNAKNLHEILI